LEGLHARLGGTVTTTLLSESEQKQLADKARRIRELTIDAIGHLGVGHIGGSMSVVDILTLLYYRHMNVDPANPRIRDRDIFVLSKGHAGPALYSVLADKGFFPQEWLYTLNVGGTNLPSHADRNRTPGVDMTTGSLGQGLSAAIGIALGNRVDEIDSTVYALIGDGDTNEGQTWEAAMAANQYKLSNLIAVTDYNKMQIDGTSDEIMDTSRLEERWRSFGWYTQQVNGHDFIQMDEAIRNAQSESSGPSMIILETIKGKGAYFCEGKTESHNMKYDRETARKAIERLYQEA
jgi:transketolase